MARPRFYMSLIVIFTSFRRTSGPVFQPGFGLDSYANQLTAQAQKAADTVPICVNCHEKQNTTILLTGHGASNDARGSACQSCHGDATALAHAGRHEEAADEFCRLVDTGPEDIEIRLTLARLLADLGHNEDAMAQLDMAAAPATVVAVTHGGVTLDLLRTLLEEGTGMRTYAAVRDPHAIETLWSRAEGDVVGPDDVERVVCWECTQRAEKGFFARRGFTRAG